MTLAHPACPSPPPPFPFLLRVGFLLVLVVVAVVIVVGSVVGMSHEEEEKDEGRRNVRRGGDKLGALASYLTSYPSLPSLTMALTFLYRRTRLIANLGLRKKNHRA